MFWNIGEHRDQKWPRSLWAAARILLSHSLLQRDNIDVFCLKEAVSHKNHNSGNFDAARMCLLHLEKQKNVLQIWA